jgi:hypothetical protein
MDARTILVDSATQFRNSSWIKKTLKRKDLPDEFINNFQTDSDIKEFLNRRNRLRIFGDSLFFDNENGIYKNFYLSNKYEPFWNSHEINYFK